MIFHRSLSNNRSPQVSRTLLSILTVLNNVVVWMVSTRPLIYKSSSPVDNRFVTLPKAPITIGITVTFMFHIFLQFPSKAQVLVFLFVFFQFYSVASRDSKDHNFPRVFFLLLLIFIWSGRLTEIRGSVCMSKSHRSLCLPFSRTDAGFCIYICSYGQI